ncbi:MAG: hypothetical protein HY568_00420 [Candidatus Latescibacteria bacterium]|nr:hypothetical protein [Candidatus Latescibacterota bacterium]
MNDMTTHAATISGIAIRFQIQCAVMTAALMLLLGFAFGLGARPARANPGAEGEPAFGISAYHVEPPQLLEATPLLVRVWGEDTYGRPIESVARVSVPDGIDVVSGDTVRVTRHLDLEEAGAIDPARVPSPITRWFASR